MNIYIHVTSEPIIEDCTDMRFAPYGQILPAQELDRLFEVKGKICILESLNGWENVWKVKLT
jgi:hypothetical protein